MANWPTSHAIRAHIRVASVVLTFLHRASTAVAANLPPGLAILAHSRRTGLVCTLLRASTAIVANLPQGAAVRARIRWTDTVFHVAEVSLANQL